MTRSAQGSGGVNLNRDAIVFWYAFPLAYKLKYAIIVLLVKLLVQQRKEAYFSLCFVVCVHTPQQFFCRVFGVADELMEAVYSPLDKAIQYT